MLRFSRRPCRNLNEELFHNVEDQRTIGNLQASGLLRSFLLGGIQLVDPLTATSNLAVSFRSEQVD